MTDTPDAELLAAAAAGDPDAYAAFFRRHVRGVTAYALVRARDAHAAGDMIADTFLVALESAGRYRPETETALPWLIGIARRVWIGSLRKDARRTRLWKKVSGVAPRLVPGEEEAIDAAIDAARQAPALQSALDTLPKGEREVLELVAYLGFTPGEAAVALDLTANAARLRLSRARRRMRASLGMPEEPAAIVEAGVDFA